MKISFSTLGCPEWSWQEIIVAAKDLGYDGIELRGIASEMYVPRAHPFTPQNIEHTKKLLTEKGLEISCVTSSCYLYEENTEKYLREGKEYIDIAQKLDSPYIRVLGDREPYPGEHIAHGRVKAMLDELGEYGADKGVMVLIETNGVYADSKVLLKLMQSLDSNNVGVLWDIHHPYRYIGEKVEDTYNRLKKYIRYVHVKDSIEKDGKVIYCLLGQGDVPVKEAISILKNNAYEGYISLEWVRRWYYELEDPGIAFPHFIHTIKRIISEV